MMKMAKEKEKGKDKKKEKDKEKRKNKSKSKKIVKEPETKKHFKKYVSYNVRLVINILIFVITFSLCSFLFFKSLEHGNTKVIKYRENNTIDYKVYLKENEFYDTPYLDKGMIYVASLIDKIKLTFNYDFNIDTNVDVDFNYKVLGDLVISSVNGATNYFKKTYTLLDTQTAKINDKNVYNLDKDLEIDYDYYNRLANNFRTQYDVDTNSYLKVYLQVDKNGGNNKNINIKDSSTSEITIPLSEKAIEINFDSKDTNLLKNIFTDKNSIFNNKFFIVACILLIISIIFLLKVIKLLLMLNKKKSPYDIILEKILREYDRLIVETTTGIDMNKSHIININKFQELLDVRDNLKLPIMYYNIASHQKCYFYIKDNDDVYLYYLKAVDLEDKKVNQNG